MRIRHYIQGNRKGKQANRIEKEAMRDPFLADAIDGYDRVKGDHASRIRHLSSRIRSRNSQRLDIFKYGSIAASLLLLLSLGTYFLFQESDPRRDMIAYQMKEISPEQMPTPPPPPETVSNTIAQNRNNTRQAAPLSLSRRARGREEIPEAIATAGHSVTDSFSMKEGINFDESEIQASLPVAARSSIDEQEEGLTQNSMAVLSSIPTKVIGEIAQREDEITIPAGKPQPAIGTREYKGYIESNIVKPADGECRNKKGKVVLMFLVDPEGKPYNIMVDKSLCASADEEAIRLLQQGPYWTLGDREVKLEVKF